MIIRSLLIATAGLIVATVSWPLSAADLGTYRDFSLGASTADVTARAGAAPRDVTTLHGRPALLEELSWRPPSANNADSIGLDSVAGIVFSFVDDQLFKMSIDYDKSRTEGLTKNDMIDSLTALYGPRSTTPGSGPQRLALDSLDTPTVLARWRQGDISIALQHSAYSGGYGLVILSVPLEALARRAQATALTIEAREAPAREAARAKAQADADKAAAEKTRTTNRATFKP